MSLMIPAYRTSPPAAGEQFQLPDIRWEKPSLFYPGRKPVGPLAINWSHPMAQKIKRAYVPQMHSWACPSGTLHSEDIVTKRRRAGTSATSFYFGVFGTQAISNPGCNCYTNAYGKVAPFGPMPAAGTFFSFFRIGGSIVANTIIGLCHADFSANHRMYNGPGASTTQWSARLGIGASQQYTVPTYATGEIHSQAVTWTSSSVKAAAYFDGANKYSFDRGASDPCSDASYSAIGYSNGAATSPHIFICGYVWDRALNATEIASLHYDPYQFLRPA